MAAAFALGAGCAEPPPAGAGPDIRLATVTAYRHAGERLESVATAGEALLSPDGSEARLAEGTLSFVGPALALAAPAVDVDLRADAARGSEGVRVDGPGYTLTGTAFAVDGASATLAVTGGVQAQARPRGGEAEGRAANEPTESAASAEPVDIDADQVVLHRRDNKAVFTGDVVVVRTGYRLTCEKLTVIYGEGQRITHLLAEGNVKVVEEDRTVTARTAEFDNVREVLTLTGDAVLVEGENVIRGDRVIFHLVTDEVRVEKVRARVRMGDAGSLGSSGR